MVLYDEPALGSLIMQQIQQQLQRIGTLVGIKQFDSARMQLREGPTSGLRRTLRETENDFVGVSDSVGRFLHLGRQFMGSNMQV